MKKIFTTIAAVFLCLMVSGCSSNILETDDGTFYAAIDDYYSDTHLSLVTLRIGRLDGTPLNEEWEPTGVLTAPDKDSMEGGFFSTFSSSVEERWFQDGDFYARYRIVTDPAHTRIAFHYFSADRTPAELDLNFSPDPAPRKTAGEMEFDDGMILESAEVAARSGILHFYLPEEEGITYREVDGEVIGQTVTQSLPVRFAALDGEGGVLWEEEGLTYPSRGGQIEGYMRLAYHVYFDDDPLPLEEAASIVLNGNEIPLTGKVG